jgi:hypothetical protein
MKNLLAAGAAFFICSLAPWAAAGLSFEEMRNSQLYDHNKNWLKSFPSSFVAANIRGNDMEYAERRLAALDLVRRQRDFGVVSELMLALEQGSFLSPEIIDVLEEWKAKRAVPLLEKVSKDPRRQADVRARAGHALTAIRDYKPAEPPRF